MWYFVLRSFIKTFVNLELLINVPRDQNVQLIRDMKKKSLELLSDVSRIQNVQLIKDMKKKSIILFKLC